MEIFINCKLQIGLLLVLIYISYLFIRDGNRLNQKTKSVRCNHYFDYLLAFGELAVIFDGASLYTVNNLDKISPITNMIVHLFFLLIYQVFVFIHFIYWLSVTDSLPKKVYKKILYYVPIIISCLITIIFIPKLSYETGISTNYSKGISAIACFISIGLYNILTIIIFFIKKNYIQQNNHTGFMMAMIAVFVLMSIQIIWNELLVSSIGVVLVIVSIYLCKENPTIKYLQFYHDEMVMGFATLVEGKDGSTGSHIRRTSAYSVLIAESLRTNPKYKHIINNDFIDYLNKAAPMHDIGKISIPDSILQKPGKLTTEEFDIMKTHPEIGANIVKRTFGHLDDGDYENMAYDIALYHHEKWNGNGYPNKLKGTDIPLSARILAVADVFDAISAKRCYRDAMPLTECYRIIKEGKESDFDPDIVDAFFTKQKDIEKIFYSCGESTLEIENYTN